MHLVPSPFVSPLLLLVLAGGTTAQTTWYVDDATCPEAGAGSTGYPFCRIQDAIDAATAGDLILVRPGEYRENIDFSGKDVVLRSVDGAPATRILGAPGGGTRVTFASGEGPGAVLDGFTMGNPLITASGQGILVDGASPTIQNNLIQNLTF